LCANEEGTGNRKRTWSEGEGLDSLVSLTFGKKERGESKGTDEEGGVCLSKVEPVTMEKGSSRYKTDKRGKTYLRRWT